MPGKPGRAGTPGQKGSLVSNFGFCLLLPLILKYVSCVGNFFRGVKGTPKSFFRRTEEMSCYATWVLNCISVS